MAECPACCETFDTESGMKCHHTIIHGESLVSVILECSSCGKDFQRPQYDVVEAENYYCSQECRKKEDGKYDCPWDGCDYTSNSELGIQQHHKRTHGESLTEVETACDWCGETFTEQRSVLDQFDHNFCSETCKYEFNAERMSKTRTGKDNPMYGREGQKHPNWSGGYERNYGTGWNEARRKTLERDDYTCQECGMTQDEHKEKYGYSLEAHHIIPFRTFDDSEEANKLENLVTVCTQCHIQVESS